MWLEKILVFFIPLLSISQCTYLHAKCIKTKDCGSSTFLMCNQGRCECTDPDNQIFVPKIKQCVSLVGATCDSQNHQGPSCIANAKCADMVCMCKAGYTPYQLSYCRPDFGLPCSSSDPCDNTRGMVCQPNSKCGCKEGMSYMESYGACFSDTTKIYLNNMEKTMVDSGLMDLFNSVLEELNKENEIDTRARTSRSRYVRETNVPDLEASAQSTRPVFSSNPGDSQSQPTFFRGIFQSLFNPGVNNPTPTQNPIFASTPIAQPQNPIVSEVPQPTPNLDSTSGQNFNNGGLFGSLGNLFRPFQNNLGGQRNNFGNNNPGIITRLVRTFRNLVNRLFDFFERTTGAAENTTRGIISRVRQAVGILFPFLQGTTGLRRDNMIGQCPAVCNNGVATVSSTSTTVASSSGNETASR